MKDLSESLKKTDVERTSARGLEAPSEVDWRTKNVLTPIKNQGSCGSFDCCGKKGFQCLGCSGAWPEWAFSYINSTGIVLETEYAYRGNEGTCQNVPNAKKYLNSAKPWNMLALDANTLKESIASSGPVSICVDASNWSLYKSGVFSNCGTTNLNHAVVAVGYQADGVWIVRNSWGATWGDHGHIRLAAGNTCGIINHAVVPNLA